MVYMTQLTGEHSCLPVVSDVHSCVCNLHKYEIKQCIYKSSSETFKICTQAMQWMEQQWSIKQRCGPVLLLMRVHCSGS
jgi:hypothetical protein